MTTSTAEPLRSVVRPQPSASPSPAYLGVGQILFLIGITANGVKIGFREARQQ